MSEKESTAVKTEIQLDEVDVLKIENYQLKLVAIQAQGERLVKEQEAFLAALSNKYGVSDIKRYNMNPQTGKGTLVGVVK